ncbi:Ank2 [Symbiodinium microadriaticum]|nr:Ank2 [Symbiodinium microadriaticum]
MSATPRFPYNSAQVFSYQVATRPRSAPFRRATRPSSQRAALWRTTPTRRQRAEKAPKAAISRSANVDSESEEEPPETHAAGQGEKVETRAARSWHIPDLQIRELVKGWEAEAATPEPVLPRAATASPSASQVNRPLLACARRKRMPETPQRPMTCEPLVSEEPILDEEAEEKARAEFEDAERQRIKYYFRDAHAATEQQPTVTEAELQRCASAPTGPAGAAKKRPALPRRNGELKQLEREAKAAKEDTRLTLNFVDTGDRYVVRVDPDLPIGPVPGQTGGDKPPSLKEIIEDISGIAPSQQILFCHRAKMGHDKYTLRSYHAHQHAQIYVRFAKGTVETPSILHACTAKWRQQQAIRNNRRDRARACSETNSKHHVMPDWQKCVVPANGTFFQYARRGIEGKLAQCFDLHHVEKTAGIRTHLFHDPFASFGDYHTWRPEHGVAEWDRLRSGPAYSHKIDYAT